jgi:hypothetical protein
VGCGVAVVVVVEEEEEEEEEEGCRRIQKTQRQTKREPYHRTFPLQASAALSRWCRGGAEVPRWCRGGAEVVPR